MSDRWTFVVSFLTVVLIGAGAFAIPQFFPYELLKSLIYLAISLLIFFGEDRFSYMLGVTTVPLWFILDILLGNFFNQWGVLFGALTGKPAASFQTPFHGLSLLAEVALFVLCLRAWRKQVSEKFFGKTFGICLVISLCYVAILGVWYFYAVAGNLPAH
jgi:hypothetical protein